MSTTDTQSHIVYANAAFVEVSGFPYEEIVGQPHNMVRHPDMPKEAFADMWATIKGGQSWTALVKNRRQNGDHYWVRANATPNGYRDISQRGRGKALEFPKISLPVIEKLGQIQNALSIQRWSKRPMSLFSTFGLTGRLYAAVAAVTVALGGSVVYTASNLSHMDELAKRPSLCTCRNYSVWRPSNSTLRALRCSCATPCSHARLRSAPPQWLM